MKNEILAAEEEAYTVIGKPGPFQVIDNEGHSVPAALFSSSSQDRYPSQDRSPSQDASPPQDAASFGAAASSGSLASGAFSFGALTSGSSSTAVEIVAPRTPPRRRYDCPNYESCLNLAAALNWDSFTCRGCSGEVNEALYWQAHQMGKRDKLVTAICDLPSLTAHRSTVVSIAPKKIAAKG